MGFNKKGLSEVVTEMLLIVVTIAALGFAVGYYITIHNQEAATESQIAKEAIYKSGQQLVVIYYTTNSSGSSFYVENIGNIPITVSGILINGTSLNNNEYSIIEYKNIAATTNIIEPSTIYQIYIAMPNITEFTINASGINYITVKI